MTKEEFKQKYGYSPEEEFKEEEINEVNTTHVLRLVYLRSDDKTFNLDIPDYKLDMTDHDITNGAKAILAENVFTPGGMDLVRVDHAQKIDTTKTDVVIA